MNKFKSILLTFFLATHLNAFDEFLISDIRIIGLQRVSTGSIFNVIPISVGDRIDNGKSRDIVKSLFSTEQFDDIQIGKEGNTLVITVAEKKVRRMLLNLFMFNYKYLEISLKTAKIINMPTSTAPIVKT